jgi:hypothetical protein
MTSRRVWTAVAILCVFATIIGGFLLGDSSYKWVGFVGVLAGIGLPFAVMAMKVRGWVMLAAFFVGLGLLLATRVAAKPAWLSLFGEAFECEILAEQMVRTSKHGKEWHYTLQCGDRRYDSVALNSIETSVGDVGDRTTVVFDRYGLVAAGRPENLSTTGYWLLPLSLLVALGFVGYAATLPIEPRQPRRSAKQRSEAKPVDQEFL